ncbi:isoprenylcysteine carboxylmethyltransferase family protein [Oryzihumus sp.]|uniref:methyltransferase family protein n=1 Tax=Oryzihumus sp. TaxID=1968903 RepID=UPI002EDB176B
MTAADLTGPQAPAEAPARASVDLGRLVGVPIMTGLLLLNASSLVREVGAGGPWTVSRAVSLAAGLLTVALYVLFVSAFLRRSRARASHPSRSAAIAAMVATWLPFALPLLPAGRPSLATLTVSNVLLVLGLGFAVWSLRYLDRSFSMVAQARRVVRTGPYAVVRHPLYTGELVALLGTVLSRPAWTTFAVWVTILGLQFYRATHEEEILAAVLPDYRDYQLQTPQLVPLAFGRLRGHRALTR